jgi:hypothetical protein
MRAGRSIPPLTLTTEERETLERWTRRPTTAQALAQRARLMLACRGQDEHPRGARVARHEADGRAMANAVSR